jgi:RimJ/RimL family protein N-acetyltransferase
MGDPILLDVPEVIETERLVLRAPQAGDGPELCAAILESLPELRTWFPWAQDAPEPDEAEENVRQARVQFLLRKDLRFHIHLRAEPGRLIGSTGLHRMDWDAGRFEIGYWLRSRDAGHGYATEAARAMATLAFRDLGANRVEIWCDARNERSAAVARRLGFHLDGTLPHHTRATDGTLATGLCFGLLRSAAATCLGIALGPQERATDRG